jgi:sulfatase maturation enzyme AslB (radical SAM superfamily)
MECKFITNGMVIQYHNFLKPCCTWQADSAWATEHSIDKVDVINWHKHPDLIKAKEQLSNGHWPKYCADCRTIEEKGRQDSIRLNGISAYSHYNEQDLTLEIRPGSVCNFACQTCWAPASTRVAQYYKQAGIDDPFKQYQPNKFDSYDFLLPVAKTLRSIVVLGGEPFYDPKCLEFFEWAKTNTTAELLLFTNGSVVNFDLLKSLGRPVTLVFSLDAIGKPAEYIRFGTNWSEVWANYQTVQTIPYVKVRVNITTSPYNLFYFPDLIDLLIKNWPEVVSFGPAMEPHFSDSVIPLSIRPMIITRLEQCIETLVGADIEKDQKSNAINAVTAAVNNLKTIPFNVKLHQQFVEFVGKMDQVKKVNLADFCPEMKSIIN